MHYPSESTSLQIILQAIKIISYISHNHFDSFFKVPFENKLDIVPIENKGEQPEHASERQIPFDNNHIFVIVGQIFLLGQQSNYAVEGHCQQIAKDANFDPFAQLAHHDSLPPVHDSHNDGDCSHYHEQHDEIGDSARPMDRGRAFAVNSSNGAVKTNDRYLPQRVKPAALGGMGPADVLFDQLQPVKQGEIHQTYEGTWTAHEEAEDDVLGVVAGVGSYCRAWEGLLLLLHHCLVVREQAGEDQQGQDHPHQVGYPQTTEHSAS